MYPGAPGNLGIDFSLIAKNQGYTGKGNPGTSNPKSPVDVFKRPTEPKDVGTDPAEIMKQLNLFGDQANINSLDFQNLLGGSNLSNAINNIRIAHARPDGQAHDWRAPGHGGHPVPGGFVNPHGHYGSNTFPSGRAKYSQEDLKLMKEMGYIN